MDNFTRKRDRFRDLMEGRITVKQYVEQVKREVRRQIAQSRRGKWS